MLTIEIIQREKEARVFHYNKPKTIRNKSYNRVYKLGIIKD
jgi:hypothetical protein